MSDFVLNDSDSEVDSDEEVSFVLFVFKKNAFNFAIISLLI